MTGGPAPRGSAARAGRAMPGRPRYRANAARMRAR